MNITYLILGILFLLIGKNLFWLFVGITGFLVGMSFANEFFVLQNMAVKTILSIVMGLIGAVLAFGFQWVAIILTGFFGGGYFLMTMFSFLDLYAYPWVVFLVGGILGIILVSLYFSWGLIILTSLVGALFIIQSFNPEDPLRTAVFLCCVVIGIIAQYNISGTA